MGGRVLAAGTFDFLHPGHLAFLRQAAELGNELYVVVARDENVERLKGRLPIHDEQQRLQQVAQVDFVTHARLGYKGANFLQVVADIAPEIIALGYDQRAPSGLGAALPESSSIVVLQAHCPEKYKSSLYRRTHSGE
ncbi:MAG: adenylyltransferase/cytidyltransferase family protein [Candidatus Latescibacteria bacterium]|nr:adenylyltransferase/cytidyltransferase family protein [Candidatus Latescibacterota bacterium]